MRGLVTTLLATTSNDDEITEATCNVFVNSSIGEDSELNAGYLMIKARLAVACQYILDNDDNCEGDGYLP